MRRAANRGFTLVENLAASMIVPVVIGGTMAAFVAAARMQRAESDGTAAQALTAARQLLEETHNHVAEDDPWFAAQAGLGWQAIDTVPVGIYTGRRMLCVTANDCDGDGAVGDCYAAQAKVCWDAPTCPVVGDPC